MIFDYPQLIKNTKLFCFVILNGLFVCFSCAEPIANSQSLNQPSLESLEASEALLNWLEERVELMVQLKADCNEMADQMFLKTSKARVQLKAWRELRAGELLALKASRDPAFGRELNQLILKGDLVHSYCAYQSEFRARLKSKRSMN